MKTLILKGLLTACIYLLIFLFCSTSWADTYILTIVPEKDVDGYVVAANAWQTEKVHAEVVNKAKMPVYTKDGASYRISCMPVTYFKGKAVSDPWVAAEATKTKAVIVKTDNPSEWLAKNGYAAPKVELKTK